MLTGPSHRSRPVKVAVVGPCASGKSTLVEQLRHRGYDAWVTAQEHSCVPELWNHRNPDVLIALRVDLETIRERRGENWSGAIYASQLERLTSAYDYAGLIIDTTRKSEDEAVDASVAFLERFAENQGALAGGAAG